MGSNDLTKDTVDIKKKFPVVLNNYVTKSLQRQNQNAQQLFKLGKISNVCMYVL